MAEPDSNTISVVMAAKLLMVTERHIQYLAKDGWITKPYTVVGTVQGYIRWRDESEKHRTKSASKSRLDDIRAEEQGFKLAALKGEFVRTDAAIQVLDDVFGPLRAALNGVPAAASRDMAVRKKIETLISRALNEAADRAEKRRNALGAGGNPSSTTVAAMARRLGTGQQGISSRGRNPRSKRAASDPIRDTVEP